MKLRLLPPVTVVDSERDALAVLNYLMRRGGAIAIDTETNGLDIMRCRVLCWSMATESTRYFIPVEYLYIFDPLFARADITWYLANAKFDLHMFRNMGIVIAGKVWDIVVMDALVDDTRPHGLKEQSHLAYGVRWGDFKELFLDPNYVAAQIGYDKKSFSQFKKMGVGEKLLTVWAENPKIVHNYASCDAFFTYTRAVDLASELTQIPTATEITPELSNLLNYFEIIEVPFTKVLWKMERRGLRVDMDRVKQLDAPLREGIRGKEYELKQLVSPTFNPNSNDELRELLFSKKGYGLAPLSYTKGKNPQASTSEKDLSSLLSRVKDQRQHDVISAILKLRHLNKLHGTFVRDIKDDLGPDGHVHPRYNQGIARTGRLTCSDPNIQQIPIRNDEFGLRSMFIAPDGHSLIDADYPQIQPRIAAVLSGEEGMMEAIRKGWDIHSANAYLMYRHQDPNITYEKIAEAKDVKEKKIDRALTDFDKKLLKFRDGAKTAGLGCLFGEGPTKMAHQLRVSVDDAKQLIQTFFTANAKIKADIDYMHEYAHQTETTYTMLGRLRRLHRINNPYNYGLVAAEERIAYNNKIQGSEVEIVKLAMLQLDASPEWNELGGQLCLMVHDELGADAPDDTVEDAKEVMTSIMAKPLHWGPIHLDLPVPVDPDAHHAKRWSDAH